MVKEKKLKGDSKIFSTSRGWFEKYKVQTRMNNARLLGEAVSAN
jgi:hypothetical protein